MVLILSGRRTRACWIISGALHGNILAIPGVSISVEHLFPSLKHTLSDAWSSMTVQTASMDIVTKQWLKLGLAERVNYTGFTSKFTRSRIYLNISISYSYSTASIWIWFTKNMIWSLQGEYDMNMIQNFRIHIIFWPALVIRSFELPWITYCTISFNSKMHVTFKISDKSPKSAKIENFFLQGFSEIGCDAWHSNWMK
jgi:hypothetical protein